MTEKKYNKLAKKIYNTITKEDPDFGDTIGALELVKLWIITDFMDLHNENNYEVVN